jgi:hypothetical protein
MELGSGQFRIARVGLKESPFALRCIVFLAILCGEPLKYANTNVTYNSVIYNSIVTYTTAEGYEFDNNDTEIQLWCSDAGEWQGDFPDVIREFFILIII